MNDASFFESRDAGGDEADRDRGAPDLVDPPPASESLPDGQFDDDDMPTTDGDPAAREDPAVEPGAGRTGTADDDP